MSLERNNLSLNENNKDRQTEKSTIPELTVAELQKALEIAQKKLQIVGSVTRHDVLNQLTAIMGYNELLSTMVKDEQLLNFLAIERRASDKMRRILLYSKVFQNIGEEPPRWNKIDLLVNIARDEIEIGTIAIRIETAHASIYSDLLIAKAFFYLFDNAIRHGKRTTEIKIRLQRTDKGAILFIEDDGVGVVPEEKEKIFEKGFGKFTGWGLYVTREILTSNGMTIRENGTAGSGACFEIQIPANRIKFESNNISK
jgi:signal transduction histidine kinase